MCSNHCYFMMLVRLPILALMFLFYLNIFQKFKSWFGIRNNECSWTLSVCSFGSCAGFCYMWLIVCWHCGGVCGSLDWSHVCFGWAYGGCVWVSLLLRWERFGFVLSFELCWLSILRALPVFIPSVSGFVRHSAKFIWLASLIDSKASWQPHASYSQSHPNRPLQHQNNQRNNLRKGEINISHILTCLSLSDW